jgi:hypothetical protein
MGASQTKKINETVKLVNNMFDSVKMKIKELMRTYKNIPNSDHARKTEFHKEMNTTVMSMLSGLISRINWIQTSLTELKKGGMLEHMDELHYMNEIKELRERFRDIREYWFSLRDENRPVMTGGALQEHEQPQNKTMDLSQYTVKQLKELIRNYNLHYHIKNFSKQPRARLEEIINDFMEFIDTRIVNKKQVEITKPKEIIKKVRVPRAKKEVKINPEAPKQEPKMEKVAIVKQKKQTETVSEKLINQFVKLSEQEKKEVAEALADMQKTTKEKIEYFKYVQNYANDNYRKHLDKLRFGLNSDEFKPNYRKKEDYINSILPLLKNRPEVIASKRLKSATEKEEVMRPLIKELTDVFKENSKASLVWFNIFSGISDCIARS